MRESFLSIININKYILNKRPTGFSSPTGQAHQSARLTTKGIAQADVVLRETISATNVSRQGTWAKIAPCPKQQQALPKTWDIPKAKAEAEAEAAAGVTIEGDGR